MNILVLLTDLFDKVGGIQTYNRSLVKALDKIAEKFDFNIKLLVLNDEKRKNNPGYFFSLKKTQYLSFGGSRLCFTLSALFYSVRASIVLIGHINFSPLAIFFRLIKRRIKMFLIVYGIEVSQSFSWLQLLALRLVDKILSISFSTQKKILEFNKLKNIHFDILPCTIGSIGNRESSFQTRTELLFPVGKMILTVSRLDANERYKNIDTVIQAMPGILDAIHNAFYVIVGDGTDRSRLEQLVFDLGLQNKVIFTGKVTNDLLSSYYKACDVFVLPSLEEGFGIVFLEAMRFSKPCIGAKAGGIPEVIEDNKTGILCEPGDIKGLTNSIIKLLKDEKLCSSMGIAGKERLEKEFSFEIFNKRLESILCH